MTNSFSSSTIDATAWLITFAPDRLKAWLDRHERPRDLEQAAREHIEDQRKRRGKDGAR